MSNYNPNIAKSFELEFSMKQYGNKYTISREYWHSDPPSMELGMSFFLSAMKLLGWDEDNVAWYFYDIVKEQLEREKGLE